MACAYCDDGEGYSCFPMYGLAPHKHVAKADEKFNWIGSTVILPREEWPDNFVEDPNEKGMGTWFCPICGEGK